MTQTIGSRDTRNHWTMVSHSVVFYQQIYQLDPWSNLTQPFHPCLDGLPMSYIGHCKLFEYQCVKVTNRTLFPIIHFWHFWSWCWKKTTPFLKKNNKYQLQPGNVGRICKVQEKGRLFECGMSCFHNMFLFKYIYEVVPQCVSLVGWDT